MLFRSLADLTEFALRLSAATDGAYDITIAPLSQLWGYGPAGKLPDPTAEQLRAALAKVGWRHLKLDKENLTLAKDPMPNAGMYYRSDHFSFARVGIPAFSVDKGQELAGAPPGTGPKAMEEYYAKRYHQPSDQYNDNWNLADMETYARFAMVINMTVANQPKLPTWREGDEFLPARVASGVK